MTTNGWIQIFLTVGLGLGLSYPLGLYMARIYQKRLGWLEKLLGPFERLLYKVCGVKPDEEMDWKQYATAMLLFNLLGALALYAIQRFQAVLPMNPQAFAAVSEDSSLNTATSFTANADWQGYGGESTFSYLTQMVGCTAQNFMSAATGIAILIALIRGMSRKESKHIGNFWVDITRTILYLLLPGSVVLAFIFLWQGMPQTFKAYQTVPLVQSTSYDDPVKDDKGNPVLEPVKDEKGIVVLEPAKDDQGNAVLEPVKDEKGNPVLDEKQQPKTQPKMQPKMQPKTKPVQVTEQVIASGPIASQEAIKQLATNGGGYFNVNSAHPYENPTPLSGFIQLVVILLIPPGLCFTFGKMMGDMRQGWALVAAMTFMFVIPLYFCVKAEAGGNPLVTPLGVNQQAIEEPGNALVKAQCGGNMEGKEVRCGVANSALWAVESTTVANGSCNSMYDSFTPLGGFIPLILIHSGEVIYGGVGVGLYGMLVVVILSVFIAGLMVGRTPEYLGKKIEAYEMKMASFVILIPPIITLIGTAIAVICDAGKLGPSNPGAHGLSEILYAYTSASFNNGSAFGGINANTPFYNFTLGFCILAGRYCCAVPALAIAGSLVKKKSVPVSSGTLPTHGVLFNSFLVCVVVIVAALNFIPVLALGPIVEHLQILK